MRRRHFLKTTGAFTVAAAAPSFLKLPGLIGDAAAAQIEAANFVLPNRLPQVINIFLYGGASELAGNLTNIHHINEVSQNPYPDDLLTNINGDNGQITANGFWRDAGGQAMEEMLSAGDLSVYRTINRVKDNTRAHRQSIFSSQKGSLNIDGSPGMGSTIAALLEANRGVLDGSSQLNGKTLDQLVLPFVSFEGTSVAFSPDSDRQLPLQLRGLSLDEGFNNPYSRGSNSHAEEIDALIRQVVNDVQKARFAKIHGGFALRERMETLIGGLQQAADNPLPTIPTGGTEVDVDADPDTGRLIYPDNNRFSSRIRAAVTLAIENSDTLFISLGGGLGSWDDHDSSLEEYAPRMQQLMAALRAATKHIKYSDAAYGGSRDTRNIVINVHGDFGRNANLNNSSGWDHGNNQNLYTLMGSAVRPAGALGKIVGETEVFGSAANNRLFTRPKNSSYQAEPMAIAATTYQYYGVTNPQALTKDSVHNPDGDGALDQTVPGVT